MQVYQIKSLTIRKLLCNHVAANTKYIFMENKNISKCLYTYSSFLNITIDFMSVS